MSPTRPGPSSCPERCLRTPVARIPLPRNRETRMSSSPLQISSPALSFAWPDGTPVFEDFQLAVGPGRTGLVGLNGSGKSTLLKLSPANSPRARGRQDRRARSDTCRRTWSWTPPHGWTRRWASTRYAPRCTPSRAATRTSGTSRRWATTGTSRSAPAPHSTSSASAAIGLDRTIGELSGGESVLLRLAALLLKRPDVLLLDEPTNNLDLPARRRLYDARRLLERGAPRGQPRPGAPGPGGPHRRPARGPTRLVRRQLHGVRGGAAGRTGGGRTDGASGRGRCPAPKA